MKRVPRFPTSDCANKMEEDYRMPGTGTHQVVNTTGGSLAFMSTYAVEATLRE